MNISLDTATERLVQEQLKSGRYRDASEVVAAAVQALSRQEAELAEVRRKIATGIDAADRGDVSDGDAFFAELDREEQDRAAQERKSA
jgi:antitoxin ParD1/3/4